MRYLLIFILLFFCVITSATTIYKQTERNGNIIYTDTPPANAKLTKVQETESTAALPITRPNVQTPVASQSETETRKPYTHFMIVSPEDQETLQNERGFPVKISLQPDLQNNDKIQLFIDGKSYGNALKNLTFDVGQLDRGIHQISAEIHGENKEVIKQSNTITIYVHYANLGVTSKGKT